MCLWWIPYIYISRNIEPKRKIVYVLQLRSDDKTHELPINFSLNMYLPKYFTIKNSIVSKSWHK